MKTEDLEFEASPPGIPVGGTLCAFTRAQTGPIRPGRITIPRGWTLVSVDAGVNNILDVARDKVEPTYDKDGNTSYSFPPFGLLIVPGHEVRVYVLRTTATSWLGCKITGEHVEHYT